MVKMKKLAKDLNIKIDYIIPNVDINDNMILIIGYESDNGSGEMVVKTVKKSPIQLSVENTNPNVPNKDTARFIISKLFGEAIYRRGAKSHGKRIHS